MRIGLFGRFEFWRVSFVVKDGGEKEGTTASFVWATGGSGSVFAETSEEADGFDGRPSLGLEPTSAPCRIWATLQEDQ